VPLPSFNEDGLLPDGTYNLTIAELTSSYLVTGEGVGDPLWDALWRRKLVDNLAILVRQLRTVSIPRVYIGGSFVEAKSHPNDIDGWFDCDVELLRTRALERRLNDIDPCWTWDPAARRRYRGYPKAQLPMWYRYRVELYPDYGQSSGIADADGNELGFPAAFRRSRTGAPRGIVVIEATDDSNRGGVPRGTAPHL